MKSKRREFLIKSGLLGVGLTSMGLGSCTGSNSKVHNVVDKSSSAQEFNMHNYAAPKLDVVRIGIIGLGNRGAGTARRLASIEGVEIKALCDLERDRVEEVAESINHLGHRPDFYSDGEEEWKKVCDRDDIDLIAIVTPWDLHTKMCVYSMESGKHAYTELPAALTIEDCWQLVETSEKTKQHCIQVSGSCHGGISAVVLNMVREGFFGEVFHAEGAYIHDLLMRYIFSKTMYHDLWRLNENIGKHGNLYPQHGLVPILQMFDINYGDKLEYISSVSSDDFLMGPTVEELASEDDFWSEYVGEDFRGNINTSIIRTHKGRTIMIQHDVTSPRPDVRFSLISGTKGVYAAPPSRIATSHDGWLSEEEFNTLIEKYTPEINKRFSEISRAATEIDRRGHSYYRVNPTDWRVIDCLRNGLPMDMNVYEAAVSSAIIPLSIKSASERSSSVDIPDFTRGSWKTNSRGMDINLERGGGTTKLL